MLNRRVLSDGLFLLATWCSWSQAATLTVGTAQSGCPSAKYTTIGAALSVARAGDEIDICPALYPEQLVITKPVTLRGVGANGIQRVLLQPAGMTTTVPGSQAVINVVDTSDVLIDGLAIDAGQNTVSGCTVTLAAIHFSNSSGIVSNNAIFGAQLSDPSSCAKLFPGNGFGVLVDTTTGHAGPFQVAIRGNSIHDFNRNGVLINGAGIRAEVSGNIISGVGPSTGYNQFGVFISTGAVANVSRNTISQGNCGAIEIGACMAARSEGIVFRAVGDNSGCRFQYHHQCPERNLPQWRQQGTNHRQFHRERRRSGRDRHSGNGRWSFHQQRHRGEHHLSRFPHRSHRKHERKGLWH